jgi:hypothetical protein
MIEVVGKWMDRWNIKINVEKSQRFTTKETGEGKMETQQAKEWEEMEVILKETDQVRILGLDIVKEGKPVSYLKSLLRRMLQRVQIMWSAKVEQACRLETVVFLYKTYADSLPFWGRGGEMAKGLQRAQDELARTENGSGEEVGLYANTSNDEVETGPGSWERPGQR